MMDFCKHNPPQFHGDPEPEKDDLWLQEIEKVFVVMRCAEEVKVTYVTYLLLNDAEYWWRGARQLLEADH